MILAAATLADTHSLIDQLTDQLAQSNTETIDWLVLVHQDPQLVDQIAAAFPGDRVATLVIPQSQWDFDQPPLRDAVDWVMQAGLSGGFVLVASAQGGCPADSEMGDEPAASGDSLLERVRRAQARGVAVERHLADQYFKLSQVPSVAEAEQDGQPELQALLYRGECGIFYAFDPDRRAYRALLPSQD